MRFSMSRHLGALGRRSQALTGLHSLAAIAAAGDTAGARAPCGPPPAEFDPVDYVSYLLYINAEIEHGLMVQYLYAAYSLGGPQVPPEFRAQVRSWQEV